MAEKGIFLKFIQSNKPVRAKIDEEMEQEVQMEDEGQYLTKSSHIFSGTDSINGSIIIQGVQDSPISKGGKRLGKDQQDIYQSGSSGRFPFASQEFAPSKDMRDPKMNTMPIMPLSPSSALD